jgi:hypothetical protein
MNKTKLSFILAVAAAASSASAATVLESSALVPAGFIPASQPGANGNATTTPASLLVDSFDSSLGSLNSVTYTLSYYSYAAYSVANDTASNPGLYTFTWQLGDLLNKNTLNEPGVNPDQLFAGVLQSDSVAVANDSVVVAGNTNHKTETFNAAAQTVAAFLGDGITQVTFVFTPHATSGINGPQGTIQNAKPDVFYAAKIDVTYDYTPTGVPEASTYAAGAVVLAGAGMILRRRMVAAKA